MRRYRLTEERKAVFLKALAVTGSPTAAAAEATPWSKHRHGGVATFRDEARRDPEFAASWERAEQAAIAAVEREIVRRAMEPPKRPVWENGALKGWIEDRASSDKLLLRLASRLDPAWRERTTVDANVSVHAEVLTVTPQDVLLLAYDDQQALLALMEKIALIREERGIEVDVPRLPAASASA